MDSHEPNNDKEKVMLERINALGEQIAPLFDGESQGVVMNVLCGLLAGALMSSDWTLDDVLSCLDMFMKEHAGMQAQAVRVQ